MKISFLPKLISSEPGAKLVAFVPHPAKAPSLAPVRLITPPALADPLA